MTGGAFASIDLVAGEKERGTLETLYVQSISAGQIAFSKFLVVLVSSIASVLLNLVGLLIAVVSGLTPGKIGGDTLIIPPIGNVSVVVLLLVPFAVLTSALLLAMSSYARSYREAQTYLLPLTILILIPVGLAAAPHVELSSIVAVVPVANVALATREAVVGRLEILPMMLVLGSTCFYAFWMLRRATHLLTREEVILVIEPPPLATDASVDGRQRRALAFGALALLEIFFVGGWLQGSRDLGPVVGTALTLWIAVLVPSLLYPIVTRRSFARTLGLRRPKLSSLALVVPMAIACSIVMAWYAQLQNVFLPFPEAVAKELERILSVKDIPAVVAFLVFALSPGVCEEFLWRGAFQGDVAARGRTWRTVLIVGFFFGVFHFSAHRFVPTAVVGGLLALVRLRTASIFPCIVFHTVYNAFALFAISRLFDEAGNTSHWLLEPWAVLGAVGIIVLCMLGLRRRASSWSR
jgi:membrane protease YdiL (CAAX protease family)